MEQLDRSANKPIVNESKLNKKTPPDGATNTNGGLTSHADDSSMAAAQDPNPALLSRQLQPSAVDDFSVEYCPPSEELVNEYIWMVSKYLTPEEASSGQLVATRQDFGQFLRAVIAITVKQANGRASTCQENQLDP